MAFKDAYIAMLKRFPGVAEPLHRLTFKDKLKWTGLILIIYFLMAETTLYGIGPAAFEQFQMLAMLLGSRFGSLMTLGIGPIVTASIILQLLVGSKLIPWDLQSDEGRTMFQGTQKVLAVLFSFAEAGIFVMMGAVPAASPGLVWIVILQLALGGILVLFMDEVVSKWGFGSGVGLFIVAGVSKTMFTRAFNPLASPAAPDVPAGFLPQAISFMGMGDPTSAFLAIMPLIATVLVFVMVIYSNGIKVEVPLAFGSVRGFGRRWPLKFFYTSNLPVILVAALVANVQLMARMLSARGWEWVGTFDANGSVTGGLAYFLTIPNNFAISGTLIFIGLFAMLGILVAYFAKKKPTRIVLIMAIVGGLAWFGMIRAIGLTGLAVVTPIDIARMVTYTLFMVVGAMIFSIFWTATAGMDARSVAGQIESTGMQIPGYRRDVRIIEKVLNRYIPGLTVIGGAAVGALAAFADFTNALGTGTGILLTTMIIYDMYERIAMQHMEDMHPAFRKLVGK